MSAMHTCFILWTLIFLFVWTFNTLNDLKVKKRIKKTPWSWNSFYYFFIFCFKGLSFKTKSKIEFWPPVNGDQLVLE